MERCKELVGKIATDKENKKLGTIIRIEKLVNKIEKVYELHTIILVKRIFRKPVLLAYSMDKVLKVEDNYVRFNIRKEVFQADVKRARDTQTEREMFTGDTGFHKVKGNLGFAFDPYRLSRKGKERRK